MRALVTLLLFSVIAADAQQPRRIISTGPGITEILFALGLGDRVVGVTDYCKYPPEAAKVPKIGSWTSTRMEQVAAAQPDLVVVQKTAVFSSARFNDFGIRTMEVRLDRIADIYSTIQAIGKAAGVEQRAKELTDSIRRELDSIAKRVSARPRTSVMFVVGRNPGALEGIVAAGGQSYLSEVMYLAGGRNAMADSPVAYPKVLHEEIIARSPQVILDMGEHADAATISEAKRKAEVALWSKFSTVSAVRSGRIHPISSAVFVVPGPRVVECARQFARYLHPELFR
ncbi:MAG TPA: ABC transporter substrate-binding protein [Bryobacteraceae bacterium]|nr:ABC transporter substrate-binding protein [Bryobacteraceae bacterium]